MTDYESVQLAIDFMEEHLREPITLDRVACATYFSLPHLYRLFNALSGRTIKEYLRLRRLSEAAKEVTSGNSTLLDIALDYQFQSQEAFTRAFRAAFGANPSEVRRSGQRPDLFPRLDLAERYLLHEDDAQCVGATIKVLHMMEPMRVAYFNAFGESPEREAWDTLLGWCTCRGLLDAESGVRLFGFRKPEPVQGSTQYGFEAWVTVGPSVEGSDSVQVKEFTGGIYAVTRAGGPKIGPVWTSMHTWLQLSKYSLGAHQWLQEYLSLPGSSAAEEVKLYLPLADTTKKGGGIVAGDRNRWVESIEVVDLEPMKVAYYRAMSQSPEGDAFDVLLGWAEKKGLLDRPGRRIFGFDNPGASPGNPVYGYEVWISVPPETRGEGDVRVKEVPGGKYAAGTTGPLNHGHDIPKAWQEMHQWVQANNRKIGRHQCLEEDLGGDFEHGLRLRLFYSLEA